MRIILTDLGEQLASEGFLSGVFPKITKVKFGDGNGNMVVPDKAMTNLVNFIQDGLGTTIARFNNPNRLYIYTMIPVTIGGITIREVGLFTDDNKLIAVGGNFEKVKPPVSESTENFDFYITLPISSTQEITVEFSNDNLYASQAALDVLTNNAEALRLELEATKDVLTNNAEALRLELEATKIVANESVPPGTVIEYASSTPPPGYLKCNGALLSRIVYSKLFKAIGTTWGVGDGSTTFALPDLRGYFPRGWDDGRGIDVSRVFGTIQADAYLNHSHTASETSAGAHTHTIAAGSSLSKFDSGLTEVNVLSPTPISTSSAGAHTHAITVNASTTGGGETRPKNIALLYCIKY